MNMLSIKNKKNVGHHPFEDSSLIRKLEITLFLTIQLKSRDKT